VSACYNMAVTKAGVNPGFSLGGGASQMNGVTDW